MKFSVLTFLALISFSSLSSAHEGHDQLPGQLKALHGGLVKTGKDMNMEMVYSQETAKFYPVAHENETIDVSKVQLTGTAKKPKGQATPLKFTFDGKSFTTKIDMKGSYRADLVINTQYEGKKDTFKFLVEK